MSKTITRKYIQRITKREGNTNIRQSSGGGGGGGGGASQYWVEENYISKLFFNQLFTVYDEDGNIVEPNDTESVIASIKSMFGFWTDAYLSALGNGEGGGAELTLASLADVDVHGVANGQALVYDATTQKWVPGQGGGIDITAMWAALAQSGVQQIDASHIATALTGYATETWVGNQGYITGSALNGYATESWVGSQISDMATQTWVSGNYLSKTDAAATYVSIAFFERLFKAYNGSTVIHPNNTTSTIDNIKAMFGFWTDFYLSALGNGSGGSTPGVTMAQVWSALGNSTTEQINISHLTTALSGYNPTSNFKTINGNSIIGTGDIVVSGGGGDYLPLTGGTLSHATTTNADSILKVINTATHTYPRGIEILTPNNSAMSTPLLMGKAYGTNNMCDIDFIYTDSGSTENAMSFGFYGNDHKVYIKANGNVGIGTTSPASRLSVFGTAYNGTPTLMISSAVGDSQYGWNYSLSALIPNLGEGQRNLITIGKAQSTCNSAILHYNHVEDGSTSNYFSVSFINANELLNIFANGNVGIGTTSPSSKLHVNGAITATGGTMSDTLSFTTYPCIRYMSGTTAKMNLGYYPTGGYSYFSNETNKYEIRIYDNGGLKYAKYDTSTIYDIYHTGNFTPSDYLPLTGGRLSGTLLVVPAGGNYSEGIRIAGGADSWCGLFLGTGDSMSGYQTTQWAVAKSNVDTFVIYRGSQGEDTNFFTITNTGIFKFRVPSANGTSGLQVIANNGSLNGWNYTISSLIPSLSSEKNVFQIGKSSSNYNSGFFGFEHTADGSSSNYLFFGLYGNDHIMSLLGNGNVGIGTNSPSTKLHVNGATTSTLAATNAAQSVLYLNNTLTAAYARGIDITFANQPASYFNTPFLFGKSDAKNNKGTISFGYVDNQSNANYVGIGFYANDNILNVTGGGLVGIGTIAPSYKLDVVGDVQATNFRGTLVGNADTATQLQTARTIWGQSFNGTGNVDGTLLITRSGMSAQGYGEGIRIVGASNQWCGLFLGTANSLGGVQSSQWTVSKSDTDTFVIYRGTQNTSTNFFTITNAGAFTLRGTLSVTSNSSIGGTLGVTGATTLSSTLSVTSNTTVGGTLGVTGATTLSSTLVVSGNAKFSGYTGFGYDADTNYRVKVKGVVYASTGVYSAGYVTALSDIRHKDVQGNVRLTVSEVANAPSVKFLWKDRRQEGVQVGSIAQYWKKVMPEAVVENADGELTMSYGVIALLASIATARKVENHERRIRELEEENKKLKQQLNAA